MNQACKSPWLLWPLAAVVSTLVPTASRAAPAADPVAAFYAGKVVGVVIGYSAGGTYDLHSRLLARHIGRYIPGTPTVVPRNMPGAGGLVAANYLYNAAPKDGTTLGFAPNLVEPQRVGVPGVQYDVREFNWLGSMSAENFVCVTRRDSAVGRFPDALTTPIKLGSGGPGSNNFVFPSLLNELFRTRFQMVTGYPGAAERFLAMERAEVDGTCDVWSGIKTRPEWLRPEDPFVHIIVQFGRRRHPELPDVPLAQELAPDARTRSVIELVSTRLVAAYPFATPPGVPRQRVAALRDAFWQTVQDPQVQSEAQNLRMEVFDPLSGEEVEKLISQHAAMPEDVVQLLARYLR